MPPLTHALLSSEAVKNSLHVRSSEMGPRHSFRPPPPHVQYRTLNSYINIAIQAYGLSW